MYDYVIIAEAPDDETMTRVSLAAIFLVRQLLDMRPYVGVAVKEEPH